MKCTGYQLREAIKRATLRSEMAKSVFKDSRQGFEDDVKDPFKAAADFLKAGCDVAQLQAAQQYYNHTLHLPQQFDKIYGRPMTLAEAVKLVGHVGSVEKEWRVMAGLKKERSYGSDPSLERDTTKVYAKTLISPVRAMAEAEVMGKMASGLRAAIATLNNTVVEFDIDESMFQ